jgi:hypothetical protein
MVNFILVDSTEPPRLPVPLPGFSVATVPADLLACFIGAMRMAGFSESLDGGLGRSGMRWLRAGSVKRLPYRGCFNLKRNLICDCSECLAFHKA